MSVEGLKISLVSDAGKLAAEQAARMHIELLPNSPVSMLGEAFVRNVYYGALIDAGLSVAHIAYVDNEPAGFIVGTNHPVGFMTHGLMRRPLRVCFELGRALLTRPSRLGVLRETAALNSARRDEDPQGTGELLSFGVLEPFRRPAFVRSRGIRLGQLLLDTAVESLRATGAQRVRAIVDSDNLPAQMFYRGAGWMLGNPAVKGWAVPSCEFVREL